VADIGELQIKALARMVHEANRAFCTSIGDNSQEPWNEAPEYNHESAMVTVRALCLNPDLSPADIHDIWVETKKKDGYVYGPVKDRTKKTHPSIIPYQDLSVEEKYKDYIVLYTVKSYTDFLEQEK
jgi:hypothetical protein